MAIINFTVEYDQLTNESTPTAGEDVGTEALVGYVYFTPQFVDSKPIMAKDYLPRPAGLRPRVFTGYIDSDGRLRAERGAEDIGVRLWANDPVLELASPLVYKVTFDLTTPMGEKVRVDGGYLPAPDEDITVNLADVLESTGYSSVSTPPTFYTLDNIASPLGVDLVSQTIAASARDVIGAVGRGDLVANVKDYGVTGDGTTDDLTAIQNVVSTHGGTKTIYFPPGRYRLGSGGGSGANRVTLPSGTHLLFAQGAVIEVNKVDGQTGAATFFAAGTDGTKTSLTANASAGAQTVALPTGSGASFSIGDIIGLESTASAGTYTGVDWYVRELHTVTAVSGDTVTLDFPLEFSYLTADSAKFWKMSCVEDIVIDGAVFETGPGVTPGTDGTYAIRLEKARNVRISNVQLRNMLGGILLHDTYDAHVTDCTIDSLRRYSDAFGYGVTIVGGSTKVTVDNLHARDTRHAFTTLADQRTATDFYGGPMHVQVNNGIGYGASGGLSIWDTHQPGRYIEFNNCQAIGGGAGVSGFQIRSSDTVLNNCSTFRNGLRSVVTTSNTARNTIRGGNFGYSGSTGLSITGTDHKIIGAHVHHSNGGGIAITSATVRPIIEACVLYDNVYGVQDFGASGSVNALIKDCVIPKSATQAISVLSLAATGIVNGGQFLGYGSTSTGIYLPESGARWTVLTDGGTVSNEDLIAPSLTTPDLGTPSAGTLTNCTGLPVSGIVGSTSEPLGVGSVQLGHASDTTLSRSAAGVVAVEGTNLARTTDVQVFTSSGTWTKPANAVSVRVRCIGPGGGGGAGARGPSGTALSGGGGGSSGGLSEATFAASDLTATVAVTVNLGSAGAAGQTSDGTAGADAANPTGSTSFGGYLFAGRGQGGRGGGLAVAGAGGGGTASNWCAGLTPGNSGGAGSATGAAGATAAVAQGPSGGGGGGGITAAAAATAGGSGGLSMGSSATQGTAGSGANGGAGPSSTAKMGGGGGGGGGGNVSGAGYSGGDGGAYGAGGGGGGASLNGSTSGGGGKGGDGVCIVTTYF